MRPCPRRCWRWLVGFVTLAVIAALVALAWPRSLGGRVSYVKVSGTSMLPTFRPGDLVIVRPAGTYRTGDVVAYVIPKGEFAAGSVVIHRIVGGSARSGFITRGDHRNADDPWRPRPADILGRQWLIMPAAGGWLGYVRAPLRIGLLCAAITFVLLMSGPRNPRGVRGPTIELPRPGQPLRPA